MVGLQYYHIAKIVLLISESSSSTYDKLRQSREIEVNAELFLPYLQLSDNSIFIRKIFATTYFAF